MKKTPDFLFVFLMAILVFLGIVMVFSSSNVMAIKNTGDSFYYIKKHIFYVIMGLFAFYLGLNLNFSTLRKRSFLILAGAFAFSLLVFVPGMGKSLGGANRWIDIGVISLQPSEFLKLAIIIFMSHLIAKGKESIIHFFGGLLPIMLLAVIMALPVLLQPDLGTTIVILGTVFLMLFIAGARIFHLFSLFLAGCVGIAGLSIAAPYRMRRWLTFLDPWADPLGAGYQIIQSMIAVSSGNIIGVGLGNSKQKFLYLPQQYADFIFAILSEELGLIGAMAVIIIFVVFFIRGLIISSRPADFFVSILGSGIILMFAVQALINIAVVLGLLPTTGLPLPFISYGGTSIVTSLFGAGILANISKK